MSMRASGLLCLVLTAACSSTNTGTYVDSAAEQACLDTVEALARAGDRCGLEYKRVYDEVLAEVANGDCKNVVLIRDEQALRERCIPLLASEPCAEVTTGRHDASCSNQLQRVARFTPTLTP